MRASFATILALCALGNASDVFSQTAVPSPSTALKSVECEKGAPTDLRCFLLAVPENRDKADSRKIHLSFGILPATGIQKQPDPILYLQGGPGEAAIGEAELWLASPLRDQRDIIFLDQRGTGTSGLECPDVSRAIGLAFTATGRTPRQELTDVQTAAAQCYTRLRNSGVDLDGYNTLQTIADIADLRIALGVTRLNVQSVSYGTRVAQVLMREQEGTIRSVVLDSGSPMNEFETVPSNLANDFTVGLKALAARCRVDNACSSAVPDVEASFEQAVALYNVSPYRQRVKAARPFGGSVTVEVTGSDLAGFLVNALKSEELAPRIPGIIDALSRRDDAVVREAVVPLIVEGYLSGGASNVATAFSVDCADNPPMLRARDRALLESRDKWSSLWIASNNAYCSVWPVKPVANYFYEANRANVPTLIVAGLFDPLSLPQETRAMGVALPQATFVEIPSGGHVSTALNACSRSIMEAFFRNPERVDTSCAATQVSRFVFE